MASAGVNVLRYSALFGGIGYGYQHQKTIYGREKANKEAAEEKRKEDLLSKAKAEWAKKHNIIEKKTPGGVIDDPNDPKFDLEAYLNMKTQETPSSSMQSRVG